MFFRNILKKAIGTYSKRDDFYGFLVNILGRKPKNRHLYSLAFIHKSVSVFDGQEKINNERLEYLGDALLGAIVAEILYKNFPHQKEGFLTKLRSKIVNRDQLNYIGKQLGFEQYIETRGCATDNIIGNSVESFVGAVYLDLGYEMTKSFVQRKVIDRFIDFEELMHTRQNFKSLLLEWGQQEKKEVVFRTIQKENSSDFYTEVLIDAVVKGEGTGSSKKKSQQHASEKALEKMKKESSSDNI